jgi:FkbM family methyltransferase
MSPSLACVDFSFGKRGKAPKPFKIAFDLSFWSQRFIHSFLSRGELFDQPLARALTDPLRPDDTFLDIGSHVGYFGLLALQVLSPGGQVYALEPNPATFEVLSCNARMSGSANFHAIHQALGDAAGSAELFINAEDEGQSSLLHNSGGAKVQVDVITLDELDAHHQFKSVGMVKIDVEGFEQKVIQGGWKFFSEKRARNVVFEINTQIPGVPPRADYPIRRMFAELGYQAYLIHPRESIDWVPKVFGDKQYVRLPLNRKMDISFGNILLTPEPIDAAEV